MRFHLVDRITEVVPGHRLRAVKHLPLGEEYLADHFPTFPVMPGVLMLHALVEAASWLVRIGRDYDKSVWVLREARNVKYGTFMAPGNVMQIAVELTKDEGDRVTFKGKGESNGQSTVAAQFTLLGYNLRDKNSAWQGRDDRLIAQLKNHCELLQPGRTVAGSVK